MFEINLDLVKALVDVIENCNISILLFVYIDAKVYWDNMRLRRLLQNPRNLIIHITKTNCCVLNNTLFFAKKHACMFINVPEKVLRMGQQKTHHSMCYITLLVKAQYRDEQ